MMKIKLSVLSILSLSTIFAITTPNTAAFADDTKVPIFTATSDAFSGSLIVNLTVDANSNVTGIDYTANGTDTAFPITNLASGIVIYQSGGKNVATLSSQNFSTSTGGNLTLTYLYDGVTSVYRNFNFALANQGQSWNAYVTNAQGTPQSFLTMNLAAKYLMGKIIGIESISVK